MENFAPSVVAQSAAPERKFRPGVRVIKLSGLIGLNERINVAAVRRQIAARDFQHLHLEIETSGGTSAEAFEIYDIFRAMTVPVSARASRECLSAGMIILMAGDFRVASPGARFLIHPSHVGREEMPERLTAASLYAQAEALLRCDRRVAQLFSDRTGHDVNWFLDEKETEELLSDVAALEVGLIHEIEGMGGQPKSGWPDAARKMLASRNIYLPPRLCSENYFSACRCAASLFEEVAA